VKIGRIREAVRRLDDIRGELKILDAESDRIEKENLPIYEHYGRTSFEDSREEPPAPEAAGHYEGIRHLHAEILAMDEKVSNLKEAPRDKPFLTKLFEGGKVIFLNSSKTLKLRSLEKQYQGLGRLLLEKGNIPGDPDFLLPYKGNREILAKNAAKAEKLKAEQAALEEEILRLGVDKRYQKRIKDLEIQNDGLGRRLSDLFGVVGREIYEKAPGPAAENETFGALAADIDLLRKRAEENAEELEKARTAVAYDGLSGRLNDLQRRLEAEEEELRGHRARIEALKAEIAETQKEKKKLEKPRR
jgi:hypothetical protein